MEIDLYQVDAFSDKLFSGNPAAVCPLDAWLDDVTLQAIAMENNLSETAFFVPTPDGFHLRWFTPTSEVRLCGHATLATAYVLIEKMAFKDANLRFQTLSGELRVSKENCLYSLDLPTVNTHPVTPPEALSEALGCTPLAVMAAEDYIVILESEYDVVRCKPSMYLLAELDLRGVCITAPGREVDFVSRFFAPKYGIHEDPVTGSAHCALTPIWANKLGKTRFVAKQLSKRGGLLHCELLGDRTKISGQAALYMQGKVVMPDMHGN